LLVNGKSISSFEILQNNNAVLGIMGNSTLLINKLPHTVFSSQICMKRLKMGVDEVPVAVEELSVEVAVLADEVTEEEVLELEVVS
jgi:hypothetical protein